MRGIKRTICALCLLALFVAYQASITAFTHVHYVNGVLITHSHPFHQPAFALHRLADCHRPAVALQFGHAGLLRAATPDALSVAGDGKRNRYARHKGKSVSDALSPRSPLFRYPLIVLYQRLVCSIPTFGYSLYRCLVFDVPIFGTRRTNVWYPSYPPLVLAVPSTGTELVSLSN